MRTALSIVILTVAVVAAGALTGDKRQQPAQASPAPINLPAPQVPAPLVADDAGASVDSGEATKIETEAQGQDRAGRGSWQSGSTPLFDAHSPAAFVAAAPAANCPGGLCSPPRSQPSGGRYRQPASAPLRYSVRSFRPVRRLFGR